MISNSFILALPPTEVTITAIPNSIVRNGSSLMLVCSATSVDNVTFEWNDPGNQPLESSLSFGYNDYGENLYNSTVVIDFITMTNEGVYRCTARNKDGFDDSTINIDVYGTLV